MPFRSLLARAKFDHKASISQQIYAWWVASIAALPKGDWTHGRKPIPNPNTLWVSQRTLLPQRIVPAPPCAPRKRKRSKKCIWARGSSVPNLLTYGRLKISHTSDYQFMKVLTCLNHGSYWDFHPAVAFTRSPPASNSGVALIRPWILGGIAAILTMWQWGSTILTAAIDDIGKLSEKHWWIRDLFCRISVPEAHCGNSKIIPNRSNL